MFKSSILRKIFAVTMLASCLATMPMFDNVEPAFAAKKKSLLALTNTLRLMKMTTATLFINSLLHSKEISGEHSILLVRLMLICS